MLFYGGWESQDSGMYESMNHCRFVHVLDSRSYGRIIDAESSVEELFP